MTSSVQTASAEHRFGARGSGGQAAPPHGHGLPALECLPAHTCHAARPYEQSHFIFIRYYEQNHCCYLTLPEVGNPKQDRTAKQVTINKHPFAFATVFSYFIGAEQRELNEILTDSNAVHKH